MKVGETVPCIIIRAWKVEPIKALLPIIMEVRLMGVNPSSTSLVFWS